MEKLKPGDKYLNVVLLGGIKVAAFSNKEAKEKNPNAPDFKGDGIAVWVNKKQAEAKEEDVL